MMRQITISLMATVFFLTIATATAAAGEIITVDFESGVPETLVVSGRTGQGLLYTDDTWAIADPQVFDLALDASGLRQGIISFDLQRLAPENEGRTVISFLDAAGDKVFRVKIEWDSRFKPGYPMIELHSNANYSASAHNLFGNYLLLDKPVAIGQWVNFTFAWDDDTRTYSVFTNGRRQDTLPRRYDYETGTVVTLEKPVSEETYGWDLTTMGEVMADVAVIRFGIHCRDDMQRCTSPLFNAVLDNFSLQTAPLDLITQVEHDAIEVAGYSGKLVAGDTLTVSMTAEPGGAATYDLGDSITGIPMSEDQASPGIYLGTYTIKPGDEVEAGDVTGRLMGELGLPAVPIAASKVIDIDGTTHLAVNSSNDLVPADESARAGITVAATDANGKAVKDRELRFTTSTTDEYTGTVGGGSVADLVGGSLDVDWDGVTDSFGEVTAQYISGFAAKTILVSAKDMVSGDVGVGWVRSYIDGEVDIVVTEPQARALSVAGTMEVSLSRDWLTADGKSRSRITAVVKDAAGQAVSGHSVQFTLLGENGSIRVIQGKTDSKGRAFADYIAGTMMGQVQIEVRDLTSGMTVVVSVELRPDAPAEIVLVADPGEVVTGDQSVITATVTDANGNPNNDVDVLYDISSGDGTLDSSSVATDEDGVASVQFTAGDAAGLVTVRGTVISREPTAEEISAAQGALFLYGLDEDPGRLDVVEWLVEAGEEVVEDQGLVVLEDRNDNTYTVVAPRDGTVSTFTAEERDRVEYGDTLGYVIEVTE